MADQMTLPFVAQPKWWHQPIARLLWLANCDAKSWADHRRYPFYRLKQQILERHGVEGHVHWQEIKHKCWSCGGTGNWGHWRDDGGDWCYKCNGTGVHRKFYVRLQTYKFGRYEFHVPGERFDEIPDDAAIVITGVIEHTKQGRKAVWAYAALMAMFEPCRLMREAMEGVSSWCRRVTRSLRWRRCCECNKIVWPWRSPYDSSYGGGHVWCSKECREEVPF